MSTINQLPTLFVPQPSAADKVVNQLPAYELLSAAPAGDLRSLLLQSASTQYVDMGNTAYQIEKNQAFTLAFWVKPMSGTSASYQVFSNLQTSPTVVGYQIYLFDNGVIVDFRGDGGGRIEADFPAMTDSVWTHVLITKAATTSASDINVYYNGVSQTPTFTQNNLSGSSVGTYNTYIGTRADMPAGQFMNGYIDQLILFNAVLNGTQIGQVYNAGAPFDMSTLTFYSSLATNYLPIGEGSDSATTIFDIKGTGNGTLVNSPTYSNDIP